MLTNFTRSKLYVPAKNSIKPFCTCALCGSYPYPVSVSDYTDFFQKPSQLNEIVRHVSNCCIAALGLYSKDYRAFTETIPCHRNRCQRISRPHVTTAADDRHIVLQHLRNKRLTAAATGKQYGIHP